MNLDTILNTLRGRAHTRDGVPPSLDAEAPPVDMILTTVRPAKVVQAVIDFVWRKCHCGVNPLCAWVVRRESHYFDGPGRTWTMDQITYAACRDAACWMLGRGEQEMLKAIKKRNQ